MNKKFVIGIVSYFPDNIREQRINRFNDLINKISEVFPNLDVFIIAQNWKDYLPHSSTNKLICVKYNYKLGILGARNKLRDRFINSNYDYLIMFDDDNIIYGDKVCGDKLIEFMHNKEFGIFNWERGQLLGFCISKSLFKTVQYPLQSAESGAVFEDVYLSQVCKILQPDFVDLNSTGMRVKADGGVQSTWWNNKKYNIKQMEINTYKLIEQYKNNLK